MSATAPESRRPRASRVRRPAGVPQQRRAHETERVVGPTAAPAAPIRTGGSWAWGLIGSALPVAVVALLVVTGVTEAAGARPGTGDGAVGTVLYLAVAAPLVAAVVVGLRAWYRGRDLVGLRAALFGVWCLVVGTAAVLLV